MRDVPHDMNGTVGIFSAQLRPHASGLHDEVIRRLPVSGVHKVDTSIIFLFGYHLVAKSLQRLAKFGNGCFKPATRDFHEHAMPWRASRTDIQDVVQNFMREIERNTRLDQSVNAAPSLRRRDWLAGRRSTILYDLRPRFRLGRSLRLGHRFITAVTGTQQAGKGKA